MLTTFRPGRGAGISDRRCIRAGESAAGGDRVAAAGAQARHRRAPVPAARLASAVSDLYAQIPVLSRISHHLVRDGVERSTPRALHRRDLLCASCGPSQFIARSDPDDERVIALATLAYRRGAYGYTLHDD